MLDCRRMLHKEAIITVTSGAVKRSASPRSLSGSIIIQYRRGKLSSYGLATNNLLTRIANHVARRIDMRSSTRQVNRRYRGRSSREYMTVHGKHGVEHYWSRARVCAHRPMRFPSRGSDYINGVRRGLYRPALYRELCGRLTWYSARMCTLLRFLTRPLRKVRAPAQSLKRPGRRSR